MSALNDIARQLSRKAVENAPVIATSVALVSAGTSVVLAARAGTKAEKVIERERRIRLRMDKDPMDRKDKFKLAWRYYVPTAVSLVVCLTSVVFLNRVGERRVASVAAAAAVAERMFTEYRDKVEERQGSEWTQEIRDELAQEHVEERPPSTETIILSDGDVLCLDGFSGRYFNSSRESLREAVNDLNRTILNDGYASLSEFYEIIGLDPTTVSDHVGWNSDKLLEVEFGSALARDGRPCMEVTFRVHPHAGYDRMV